MDSAKLTQAVSKELERLRLGASVLCHTEPQHSAQTTDCVLAGLVKKGWRGICITTSGYEQIKKRLQEAGVDIDALYFIDALTPHTSQAKSGSMVFYTQGPAALTDISIGLTEGLAESKYHFILLEDLALLEAYSPQPSIEKFVRYLFGKSAQYNIAVVIATTQDRNDAEMAQLRRQAGEYLEFGE